MHLDGSLAFTNWHALYRLRPNVSFALGYSAVAGAPRLGADQAIGGFFNFNSKGPEFFVRVAF